MPQHSWVFPARLVRVIDGDTVVTECDCGFSTYRIDHLRLLGVNAPEVRGPTYAAGLAATAYARGWLDEAVGEWPLIIETHKSDSFGRYLALIWRQIDQRQLNEDLVSSGNAVPFMV